MDRRTFIKSGALALGGLAAARIVHAWPPINPSMIGGAGSLSPTSVPWGSWDGLSQYTLNVDQNTDGVEDTNVCAMKNTTASGNETSTGVQTGVNLIYIQHGSIVGATGTPPYRLLSSDYFEIPSATLAKDIFSTAGQTWSVFVKCRIDSTSQRIIFELIDNVSPTNRMILYVEGGTASIGLSIQEASGAVDSVYVSEAYPTNTDLIIGAWADGSDFVRAGFSTNRPICLSG